MNTKGKRKPPEVVYREGKPRAVILDIEEYQEMLERLEDVEDLQMLERMKKEPLSFRTFEDFLVEHSCDSNLPIPTKPESS